LAIRLSRLVPSSHVEVACLSKWGPVADQLKTAGIEVTALGARGSTDLRTLPRLIRLIEAKKFDTVFSFLVHANGLAAAASLWVRDVRWIQSIQTTQPTPTWHWRVQRLVQRAADAVVMPSTSVARAAVDWAGVPMDRLVVIPNAIDPSDWAGAQSHVPCNDPRPYPITFLGRLDPIKDVPTLVQAVRQLGSLVHLHIYGEGSDRQRIEKAIAAGGLQNRITLKGAIDHPQAALPSSGLLVLPSLAEGFGLVLIEAMAAGVPVVATNVAGICDVVRDGVTGLLVPPADPDRLAAAIRQMVENKPLRQRCVTAAASEVRERFTWDVVLEQYIRLLGLQR
jgi:glycosyltransferase involved in cell wall biosynthesis